MSKQVPKQQALRELQRRVTILANEFTGKPKTNKAIERFTQRAHKICRRFRLSTKLSKEDFTLVVQQPSPGKLHLQFDLGDDAPKWLQEAFTK